MMSSKMHAGVMWGLLALAWAGSAGAQSPEPPFSWDAATVYFVMTDRFLNGDPANDHAYGRGLDAEGAPYDFDPSGHFHGGDLAGLTQKIEEGYFDALGVHALWITNPFEQIHGWIGGGEGDFQFYAYHGYWVLDFTELDAALGREADFRRFVDTAHAHGLRVVLDVILNHAGYPTLADMDAFGFGALTDEGRRTWRPAGGENRHGYHDRFIDYAGADSAWARWWGPEWVRAGLPGYDPCGDDEITQCLGSLPDFKTASDTPVEIPVFLREKWGPEKLAKERAELDAFFARTGYPRTPRYHLIKWVTDWVERYGIDGFRVDTARHVEPETWQALKREAVRALRAWKAAHPGKALDDLDFWMTGEVWGHGVERDAYFDAGFDSLINFTFQPAAAAPVDLDSLYAAYAGRINGDPSFNVLSYLSSHDTRLFDRTRLVDAGTRLLMLPGGVVIYYGDETARPPGPDVSAADQPTRSPMNWDAVDADVLAHWQKLGRFRRRHPAVARGAHRKLADAPYAFHRHYASGTFTDDVIVVMGAEGRTRLNVSHVFPDDTVLRDAYTGKIAIVSYGLVTFAPGPQGVLLIEEVR
jgi:alpha-amylase